MTSTALSAMLLLMVVVFFVAGIVLVIAGLTRVRHLRRSSVAARIAADETA
jgi:hypothetical protein